MTASHALSQLSYSPAPMINNRGPTDCQPDPT